MSGQNVGNTALGAATCRLIEQYQPKHFRLFVDPVVGDLVGGLIRTLMRSAWMRRVAVRRMEGMLPGLYGAQVCRTRYIDDVVQSGTGHGIDQLVLLGAGLDTRPYRLPGVGGVTVFELDLPALQVRKQARLRNCLRSLPDNVRFVPVDFDVDDLGTILAKAGFDRSRPAVFVWEGVTQYITEAAVRRTLTFVGGCATGSILVFTYVLRSIVERRSHVPGANALMDYLTAKNRAPWIFGLEPEELRPFVETYHLGVIEDVGNREYQTRYLSPRGRSLLVTDAERVVHLVRA